MKTLQVHKCILDI